MSRALFVSDIHLSSSRDPKCELFLRVLGRCAERGIDHLFLVGDIFDLWIADRTYFVREYAAVVDKLRRLHAMGIHIYYFEGNHDLDIACFWRDQVGVRVYSGAEYFSLNGLEIRVEHGDQMDPEDRGYLFLRWFLRTPVLVFLGRYLPDFAVKWIGSRASAKSRVYTTSVKSATDEQVRGKIRAHAQRAFAERPFDFIVSGHVHVVENSTQMSPGGRKFGCVNLGTWLKEPVVLDLDGGTAALKGAERFVEES